MDTRDVYWAWMRKCKYDLECAEYAFRKAVKYNRRIKIFLALVSSGAIASWAVWQHFAFLWASLIAAGQICAVIYEYTPYQERVFKLSHMTSDLEKLFVDIETGCLNMATGSLSEKEIYELKSSLSYKWQEIEAKYSFYDNILIPPNIAREIEDATNLYFKNIYGVAA